MPNSNKKSIILASQSPRRLELLNQINILPDKIVPADIDETPQKGEKPHRLVERLSEAKALKVSADYRDSYILAADTVVACGQVILEKPNDQNEAREMIKKLSGRRHQVFGGITLITPEEKTLKRTIKTLVKFKLLSGSEIDQYIDSGEWEGKAGGYGIQGVAEAFVSYMAGSYSNVVGLSLYDTMQLLRSGGFITDNKKD